MPNNYLLFKSLREEKEWNSGRLSSVLKDIILDAAQYAFNKYGWIFTITSIWRTLAEDKDLGGKAIHPAWRAVDIRTRTPLPTKAMLSNPTYKRANEISPEWVIDVANYINSKYIYDPARPNMMVFYIKPHGNAPHIHAQVHLSTRKRG